MERRSFENFRREGNPRSRVYRKHSHETPEVGRNPKSGFQTQSTGSGSDLGRKTEVVEGDPTGDSDRLEPRGVFLDQTTYSPVPASLHPDSYRSVTTYTPKPGPLLCYTSVLVLPTEVLVRTQPPYGVVPVHLSPRRNVCRPPSRSSPGESSKGHPGRTGRGGVPSRSSSASTT